MRFSPRLASGLLIIALLASGCQRLDKEFNVELDGYTVKEFGFDPPRYDQKVTVTANSPGIPLLVYLVKEEDREKSVDALQRNKAPEGALGGEKGEDVNFTVAIPSKTSYWVLINSIGKKTTVKLKVTGR